MENSQRSSHEKKCTYTLWNGSTCALICVSFSFSLCAFRCLFGPISRYSNTINWHLFGCCSNRALYTTYHNLISMSIVAKNSHIMQTWLELLIFSFRQSNAPQSDIISKHFPVMFIYICTVFFGVTISILCANILCLYLYLYSAVVRTDTSIAWRFYHSTKSKWLTGKIFGE